MDDGQTQSRKKDHIKICLTEPVNFDKKSGFENYEFEPTLPSIDIDKIDTSIDFFGKKLAAPIYISGMIGGVEEAGRINKNLAKAAQLSGLAMGVGSMRAAIEKPEVAYTYQVRDVAPDIFLLANVGASQLTEYSTEQILSLIELIDADALAIHINPVQEVVQSDGTKNWEGVMERISEICKASKKPVIAKEVGCGIPGSMAKQLAAAGVKAIDVAGAGGTSWVKVEYFRGNEIAKSFWEWGKPTAECLAECVQAVNLPILASGGIRAGEDIAKAVTLGAKAAGMARPLLREAVNSAEKAHQFLENLKLELRSTMFLVGAKNIESLKAAKLVKRG